MKTTKTEPKNFYINQNALEIKISPIVWQFSDNKKLQTLQNSFDVNDLHEIITSFYDSTQLGIAIYDESHRLIATHGWQNICTNFHQNNTNSKQSCIDSENYFKQHFKTNTALGYKCKNGLWDIAYPIIIDDVLIGKVLFGQFFFDNENIDKSFFIRQAEKYNFDKELYLAQLRNVPILSKSKIEAYIKLFLQILAVLSKG